ncbi:hypothetical protein ID866_8185 [Astraeus odoratus]|nr:hypothetical protein ID866_8185 [Astraeus odoratus]
MPTEYSSSDSQDYPLQRLDAENKGSDVELCDEDKEAQERPPSLSSDSRLSSRYSRYSTEFDDPNLDLEEEDELDEDSPYPEVRAAVANTDDPTIPATTIRTWVLGMACAIIVPGLNQFMSFRYPSVTINALVAQLVTFPIGMLWAAYMPRKRILDQWFLVISTQLIGFSAGGIARRFLVSPPSMIWPSTLVTCAMFNTLHSQQYAGVGQLGGISRERFFVYAFLAAFVWNFFPGYMFQALSYFSWVTWIWPDNAVIAQLFGYVSSRLFSLSLIPNM